ncbi:MAG: glycosyltransferase family 4 protein [bacterium]
MTTRKLRIIHTESSCGWGGQEIRILNEARGFLQRGHQVELVCSSQAEIFKAAQDLGIVVHGLPIEKKRVSALLAMRSWLKTHMSRFDVINSHSSTDSWLVALGMLGLQKKAPVVRTRHVSTTVNRSAATRWLYQTATRYIVTTGEALRQQLHQDNTFDLARMKSIPTGVRSDVFYTRNRAHMREKLGLPASAFLFGIVATLRDWKGHNYLFEAFHALKEKWSDARIVVVGDGPYEDRLHSHLQRLQLAGSVDFVGRQENVAEWMNAFDVFCLPSYGEEGVPQALMQAMACGAAVVSTPVGSIAEAVIDEQTGLMVEPENVEQLAQAMLRLYQDAVLRQRLGAAASKYIHLNFGYENMLDQMEHVFRQVQVQH